jgi:hypothetical protein
VIATSNTVLRGKAVLGVNVAVRLFTQRSLPSTRGVICSALATESWFIARSNTSRIAPLGESRSPFSGERETMMGEISFEFTGVKTTVGLGGNGVGVAGTGAFVGAGMAGTGVGWLAHAEASIEMTTHAISMRRDARREVWIKFMCPPQSKTPLG